MNIECPLLTIVYSFWRHRDGFSGEFQPVKNWALAFRQVFQSFIYLWKYKLSTVSGEKRITKKRNKTRDLI